MLLQKSACWLPKSRISTYFPLHSDLRLLQHLGTNSSDRKKTFWCSKFWNPTFKFFGGTFLIQVIQGLIFQNLFLPHFLHIWATWFSLKNADSRITDWGLPHYKCLVHAKSEKPFESRYNTSAAGSQMNQGLKERKVLVRNQFWVQRTCDENLGLHSAHAR